MDDVVEDAARAVSDPLDVAAAMDASTLARLAWSGWTHVTRRRRAISDKAAELWRDRSKRLLARSLVAWSRSVKFQTKRREMLVERARSKNAIAAKSRTLLAWKATTRSLRETRRDVVRQYLLWRAKQFLRAWREAAAESAKDKPKKEVRAEDAAPTVSKISTTTSTTTITTTAAATSSPADSPRESVKSPRRERMSVDAMKQRLWTKADPSSKPMPVSHVVEEIETQVRAESPKASTPTTTQRVQIQRRKVSVRAAGTPPPAGTSSSAEDVKIIRTPSSSGSKTSAAMPPIKVVDASTMTSDALVMVSPDPSATISHRTSSSTSAVSLFSIVIFVLALFGAFVLSGLFLGFSIAPGEGSQMVRQHLSEAQRNVTILARASAMQRRELEACRTFGGGIPDASQNAAIASAQAKVSDTIVQVADLETKLAQANAEVAAAVSAQKLAEDRFNRLGSGAMKTAILQESLANAQKRAEYCESTAAQAIKLKIAKDAAEARAESAERDLATTSSQFSKSQSHLASAQRALTKTTEVANECRKRIGMKPYVPSYHSGSSILSTIADMFPAFRWFFSTSALIFYFVCGYSYYLRVMVNELVGERNTLVSELAKLRTEGVDVQPGLTQRRRQERMIEQEESLDVAAQDRKRSRSVDDMTAETTTQKKTATSELVSIEEVAHVVTAADYEEPYDKEDDEEEDANAVEDPYDEEPTIPSEDAEAVDPKTSGSDSEERRERANKLMDRWVEKSQDEEINEELERIRRIVKSEDEREKKAEEEQMEVLRRRLSVKAHVSKIDSFPTGSS